MNIADMRRSRIVFVVVAGIGIVGATLALKNPDEVASALSRIDVVSREETPSIKAGSRKGAVAKPDAADSWARMTKALQDGGSNPVCVKAIIEVARTARAELIGERIVEDGTSNALQLNAFTRAGRQFGNDEELLASIILGRQDGGKIDDAFIKNLLDLGARAAKSDSPVLAWHALRVCAENSFACPYANLEPNLLDIDGDNAEAWALVATLRHGRGDTMGALAAMKGAASAETSTWHWPDTIALIERSLKIGTSIPYEERVSTAFSSAASSAFPSQAGLLGMCRSESAASKEWMDACLAFSKKRGEMNETEMARSSSYSLRQEVLRATGDWDGAAEARIGAASFDAARLAGGLEVVRAKSSLEEALITSDPSRLQAFLEAIKRDGETLGTRAFLKKEVPHLLHRTNATATNESKECIAQLFDVRQAADAAYGVRPGDELHISVRGRGAMTMSRQVGSNGAISIPRARNSPIMAIGKSADQIQREIAAALSDSVQTPDVVVVIFPKPAGEALQDKFAKAQVDVGVLPH